MKKNKQILLVFSIVIIICLVIFGIYKMCTYETYKKLRDIGDFQLDFNTVKNKLIKNDNDEDHKYGGHRYKQSRRYNFLSQQNNRNQ